MNRILSLKEFKELFKSEKSVKIILISGAAIIILIALSGLSGSTNTSEASELFNYKRQYEYEAALEERLAKILSEIEGIGNINIMITLDSSEENQFQKSGSTPTRITTPEIRGVIVVCDGGDNILIREKVISSVSGAFGISSTRVSVIK